MNYITDKEIDAIQGDMGETLRKQPRVRMRIEGSGYWEGGINGWFFRVRRGEETELPKSIAELIQRSEQVVVMGEREVKVLQGRWQKGGAGMTLNDIIVSALAQLDRGHDAQSLDVWRDKFTRFANDGVTDICATYKPRRTETIDTRDGTFTTAMLSRGCRKVLSVKRDGREEDFYDGDASEVIVTSGGPGKIEVTYRSVPREMFASTDEPDIPAYMHGLLVSYVVGRERAAGDVSQQRGGNIYFQMYEAGKAAIRPHLGGGTSQRIVNRW